MHSLILSYKGCSTIFIPSVLINPLLYQFRVAIADPFEELCGYLGHLGILNDITFSILEFDLFT